jgi:arylsulfatase A-like enzyme
MNQSPNLLFIFTDEHRKIDLGCYGNKEVMTPHIDFLAANGLRFENCISNAPVCVPARGSLMTGLCAQKHGAYTNDLEIRYDVESIADVLNCAGYHTGYIGKWHLCGVPRDQYIDCKRRLGFTEWKVTNCNHHYKNCYYDDDENVRHFIDGYEPEIFGKLAADFLDQNMDRDQPFALFLSFATPHEPHGVVGEEYLKMYEDRTVSARPNVPDDIMVTLKKSITKEESLVALKGYYAHIMAIDRQVGILLEKLRRKGLLEHTLVVFTADHGSMLGSHGTVHKQLPYEESCAVPLILSMNGYISTGVSDTIIGLTDLPVTVAGLLGLKFEQETDGLDLSGTIIGNELGPDSCYLYDLYPCHQAFDKGMFAWRAIRTKKYTYAIRAIGTDWLLFDNENDPYQLHNLIDDEAADEVKKELRQKLSAYVEKYDGFMDGNEYIRFSNRVEDFNKSQKYFNRPTLQELESEKR